MTIQANEIKILDQILLVDLSGIHLWTARKKLKPEMLEGKIPPATLASLGSMRVIDPEKLKPFEKIKRQATKVVEECGVKFLGGYAISQDRIQDVVDRLEALKTQFYDLKNNFLPNYDRWVTEWIDKGWEKQEWRDAIRSSVTPKGVVDAGMQFGYAACRVAPDGDKHLSGTLGGQVRGLADQLYAETAETAERLLETGLATRGHVTQTTLNTVRKINAKLRGLMFLSSDVKALSEHIDAILAALPTSGVVNGTQYNTVVTLVSSLSDEDSIKRLIKHLNQAVGQVATLAVQEPDAVAQIEPQQNEPVQDSTPEPVEASSAQAPQVEAVEEVEEELEEADEAVLATLFQFRPSNEQSSVVAAEQATDEVPADAATEPDIAPEPLPQAAGFWF